MTRNNCLDQNESGSNIETEPNRCGTLNENVVTSSKLLVETKQNNCGTTNEDNIPANIAYEEIADEAPESSIKKYCKKIKNFIISNYLPVSLIFVVIFGALVPQPGVAINHKATQYICVVGIFLYSGLYLRTSAIKDSLKAYRAAIWGIISILGVTSIIGGQLTSLLNFDKVYEMTKSCNVSYNINNGTMSSNVTAWRTAIKNSTVTMYGLGPEEFQKGLIVYLCMPCTVSSGIVMVTQLNGNFALALLLTVVANVAGVFTIPLFLKWLLTRNTNINFDVAGLFLRLFLSLLLPIIIGKALRCVAKIRIFVTKPERKLVLKLISISLLAIIIWMKVSKSTKDGTLKRLTVASAFFIVAWVLTIHCLFLILNTMASWILRLKVDQKKCIIILASQKTLAVAIPVITFLPHELGDQGLMAVAMVISHISILLFDAVLIPLWLACEKRLEQRQKEDADDTSKILNKSGAEACSENL